MNVSNAFMSYKWDSLLPWEQRKPFTVMSFSDSLQHGKFIEGDELLGSFLHRGTLGNVFKQLGPTSIRKGSNMASSTLYQREVLRPQSIAIRPKSVARPRGNSGAISLDISALQGEDADFHIRAGLFSLIAAIYSSFSLMNSRC